MLERISVTHWFLVCGGTMTTMGLILWLTLPVPLSFPPYLATGFLALVYGGVRLTRVRATGKGNS